MADMHYYVALLEFFKSSAFSHLSSEIIEIVPGCIWRFVKLRF